MEKKEITKIPIYTKKKLKSMLMKDVVAIAKSIKLSRTSHLNKIHLSEAIWRKQHGRLINHNKLHEVNWAVVNGAKPTIDSPGELLDRWNSYKLECKKHTVKKWFNTKEGLVEKDVSKPKAYFFIGFLTSMSITKQSFHETYDTKEGFPYVIKSIMQECENSKLGVFMDGTSSPALAPLFMSKHGYSVKTENETKIAASVNIPQAHALVADMFKKGDTDG